ncbi:hypothetical protein RND81_11G026600 [Saponaria officinalis]|uniref:Hexosyltransferase n=1 Tax=Saponaria officinalis TaxID=3572 RepID=A0AAW1HH76_SAPOF
MTSLSGNSLVIIPLTLILLILHFHRSSAVRTLHRGAILEFHPSLHFSEAPEYRNGDHCPSTSSLPSTCHPLLIHVAMTLDYEYLRGSIAAVHSVLKHAVCPENVFFHFIAAEFDSLSPRVLSQLVRSTFPSLNFNVHIFREDAVINLISSSVRHALENPLNYARNYLGDILDTCVHRVIYLDSDVILVDDIEKLWSMTLTKSTLIGAPEYCHANFTSYFTHAFWADPELRSIFSTRTKRPCYFNTGVMLIDLKQWREGNYRRKIEKWMEIQKKKRIYELGSLPPFLLEFAGKVEGINHRWNQHGLGGDNVRGSCRALHPGPVSLLHWSGKGKPWVRIRKGKPCPLDYIWLPYDLFKGHRGFGF